MGFSDFSGALIGVGFGAIPVLGFRVSKGLRVKHLRNFPADVFVWLGGSALRLSVEIQKCGL